MVVDIVWGCCDRVVIWVQCVIAGIVSGNWCMVVSITRDFWHYVVIIYCSWHRVWSHHVWLSISCVVVDMIDRAWLLSSLVVVVRDCCYRMLLLALFVVDGTACDC